MPAKSLIRTAPQVRAILAGATQVRIPAKYPVLDAPFINIIPKGGKWFAKYDYDLDDGETEVCALYAIGDRPGDSEDLYAEIRAYIDAARSAQEKKCFE